MEEAKLEEASDQHASRVQYTMEEDVAICKFLHARTHDPTDGLLEKFRWCPKGKKLWDEFKEETGSDRPNVSIASRFTKIMAKLHEIPISVEMRLDLYYSLSVPIHKDFIEEAQINAHLALDEDGNIEAFEMKPEEERVHVPAKAVSRKRRISKAKPEENETAPMAKKTYKKFTEEEDVNMMKFLFEKICDPVTGKARRDEKFIPKSIKIWTEFSEKHGSERMPKAYAVHYNRAAERLHKLPLELRMKAELFYGLRVPVNSEFLEALKKKSAVKTDADGCIAEYDSESLKEEEVV